MSGQKLLEMCSRNVIWSINLAAAFLGQCLLLGDAIFLSLFPWKMLMTLFSRSPLSRGDMEDEIAINHAC